MLNKLKKFKKKFKNTVSKLVHTNISGHEIALGFALGTFISITIPVVGFWVGVLASLVYKKINKLSLFGSIIFWNPFFLTPIYLLSYKIGNHIFGASENNNYKIEILNVIY
jgi:uncharacterized protein (DUF2062 family)